MKKLDELKDSVKKAIVELYEQHEKSTDKYQFLHELEELFKDLRQKNKN